EPCPCLLKLPSPALQDAAPGLLDAFGRSASAGLCHLTVQDLSPARRAQPGPLVQHGRRPLVLTPDTRLEVDLGQRLTRHHSPPYPRRGRGGRARSRLAIRRRCRSRGGRTAPTPPAAAAHAPSPPPARG